jgi:hypothetical protein
MPHGPAPPGMSSETDLLNGELCHRFLGCRVHRISSGPCAGQPLRPQPPCRSYVPTSTASCCMSSVLGRVGVLAFRVPKAEGLASTVASYHVSALDLGCFEVHDARVSQHGLRAETLGQYGTDVPSSFSLATGEVLPAGFTSSIGIVGFVGVGCQQSQQLAQSLQRSTSPSKQSTEEPSAVFA